MPRPRKEIDWEAAAKLASIHCTVADMAEFMKISVDTLERACKRQHKMRIAEWCDQKRGAGRAALRNMQFAAAKKGNPAMLIWLGKQWLGQHDRKEVEISGNPDKPALSLGQAKALELTHEQRLAEIERLRALRLANGATNA